MNFYCLFIFAAALARKRPPDVTKLKVNGKEQASPPPSNEPPESEISIAHEWEEHMMDFVPADLVTFEINPRGEQEFLEEISVVPSVIRGAWFTAGTENKDIEFTIFGPNKEPLLKKSSKKEALFRLEATEKGLYTFHFKNKKILRTQRMTFALHCGNSTEEVLHAEHLDPVEHKLLSLQGSVKDFQVDQQFAQLRQEAYYRTLADSNVNLLWLSLIECVGIACVTAWQIYYIKRLLDNKRVF